MPKTPPELFCDPGEVERTMEPSRLVRVRVIVNPTAGSGRAGRNGSLLGDALRGAGVDAEVVETRGPRDAERIAREALEAQDDVLVAVGGDGTLNEVVHGYMNGAGHPVKGPALCVFPAGTGGDFRKTFGWTDAIDACVQRLLENERTPLDLGIVDVTRTDGSTERRAFVNIMSFGLGGLTDEIVNRGPKWLGGRTAFLLGALRATLVYHPAPVELFVDGRLALEAPVVNVALANGRYFGGGMKIAPDADPSDGLLDVVAICDRTSFQSIALTPHVYRGTHVHLPGVHTLRGRVIEARPTRPADQVLVDLDGENPGRLPIRAELIPGAIDLIR